MCDDYPNCLFEIDGNGITEFIKTFPSLEPTKENLLSLEEFERNFTPDRQNMFRFQGLLFNQISNYYESVCTSRTSGGARLMRNKKKDPLKVYIREDYANPNAQLISVREYDTGTLVEQPRSRLEFIRDREKSLYDVGRFQIQKSCQKAKNIKPSAFIDIIKHNKSKDRNIGYLFEGYYVISGTHMSLDSFYYSLKKFIKMNKINQKKTYFYTDLLCASNELFDNDSKVFTEDDITFLKEDFMKAVALFDKFVVVLDSWKCPLTLLSAYVIWQIKALMKYGKDFQIMLKINTKNIDNDKKVWDRKEIYDITNISPTLSVYPLMFGRGPVRTSNANKSIYKQLHLFTLSSDQKDLFLTEALEEIFKSDDQLSFDIIKTEVYDLVKKKIAQCLLKKVVSGLLNQFKPSPNITSLHKLRNCAAFLHQLNETSLAIGLCDRISSLCSRLKLDIGVADLRCHLSLDKVMFHLESITQEQQQLTIKDIDLPIITYTATNFVRKLMAKVKFGFLIDFPQKVEEAFINFFIEHLQTDTIDMNKPETFLSELNELFAKLRWSSGLEDNPLLKSSDLNKVFEENTIKPEKPNKVLIIRNIFMKVYIVEDDKTMLNIFEEFKNFARNVNFNLHEEFKFDICSMYLNFMSKLFDKNLHSTVNEQDFQYLKILMNDFTRDKQNCVEIELNTLAGRWYSVDNQDEADKSFKYTQKCAEHYVLKEPLRP